MKRSFCRALFVVRKSFLKNFHEDGSLPPDFSGVSGRNSCKSGVQERFSKNITSWGNYSNDAFSEEARGKYTGAWEEAKANNIYDLAGNNWEWTQERCGSSYVMRGGYNLMGGACPRDRYPAALRDPLPGNDHHPNVCFRIALYLK